MRIILIVALFFIFFTMRAALYSNNKLPDTTYITGDNDYNLIKAAEKNDSTAAIMFLKAGANPRATNDEGITAMMCAVKGGYISICNILLKHGANVNTMPGSGHSPLTTAVQAGYVEIAELLIKSGAIINATDFLGRSPLIYAAAKGDTKMCEMLLFNGANINIKDNDSIDALLGAVINEKVETTELLLKKGANVNTKDYRSITPIVIASGKGNEKIISILIKYKADINPKDKHLIVPLVAAVQSKDTGIVNLLINKGCELNDFSYQGRSALVSAKYYADQGMIKLLKQRGAKQSIFPSFRKIIIAPEFNWNLTDFMTGFSLSFKEYNFKSDFYSGFYFRPLSNRVLIKMSDNSYHQLWERRNMFFIGINKNFETYFPGEHSWAGVSIGAQEVYTYGHYRGASFKVPEKFITSPIAGVYYLVYGLQLKISYSYADFKTEGVSPHRITFSIGVSINTTTDYNANDYKKWE